MIDTWALFKPGNDGYFVADAVGVISNKGSARFDGILIRYETIGGTLVCNSAQSGKAGTD